MRSTRIAAALVVATCSSSGCGQKEAPSPAPAPRAATVAPAPPPLPAPGPSEARRKLDAAKMALDIDAPLLPPVFQRFAEATGVDFWITESLAIDPPVIHELRIDPAAPVPE